MASNGRAGSSPAPGTIGYEPQYPSICLTALNSKNSGLFCLIIGESGLGASVMRANLSPENYLRAIF